MNKEVYFFAFGLLAVALFGTFLTIVSYGAISITPTLRVTTATARPDVRNTPTVSSIYISRATSVPRATRTPASQVCPRNCSTAVAAGMSAQEAGRCPKLDRDKDGVACYGD